MAGRKKDPTLPKGARSFMNVGGTDHDQGHDLVRIKMPSPARLSHAVPPEDVPVTAEIVPSHTAGGKFAPGNKAAVGKGKSKLGGAMGLHPDIFKDSSDPSYRRCMAKAAGYRRERIRELMNAHGYVSGGVSSQIANAALALSSSRYLLELASNVKDLDDRVRLMKESQAMARQGQAHELAAWELCAREAGVKKANKKDDLPWLQQSKEEPNE